MKLNHLQSGDMTRQVQLQSNSTSTGDAFNELVPTFTTYATVWASIDSLSAREIPLAKSFAATVNVKIRIRWRNDIKATHKILMQRSGCADRIFTIDGIVTPNEYPEYMIVYCTEVVPQ